MNYLQRLHVLFVSTLSMIVVWVGILGWAEVARGQGSYEVLHAFEQGAQYPYADVLQDSVRATSTARRTGAGRLGPARCTSWRPMGP